MGLFNTSKAMLDAIKGVVADGRKQYAEEEQQRDRLVAEKILSPKQKKIAAVAGDKDKIDAADFASLRAGKKVAEATGNPGPVRKPVPVSFKEKPSKEDMAAWHAKQKVTKEDVEGIDEISKNTLQNYIAGASTDMARSGNTLGRLQTHGKLPDVEKRISKALSNRYHGINKAAEKLTKEAVESVDELSKPMLATYIRRASDPTHPKSNVNLSSLAADKLSKGDNRDDGQKEDKKAYNRSRSIGLAAAKMAREATERDTPGNSTHQCAVHVKHSTFGEGKALYSQHAEPDNNGLIEWYDIMFEHGIEKQVPTTDLEVLEAMSHGNHKGKK